MAVMDKTSAVWRQCQSKWTKRNALQMGATCKNVACPFLIPAEGFHMNGTALVLLGANGNHEKTHVGASTSLWFAFGDID